MPNPENGWYNIPAFDQTPPYPKKKEKATKRPKHTLGNPSFCPACVEAMESIGSCTCAIGGTHTPDAGPDVTTPAQEEQRDIRPATLPVEVTFDFSGEYCPQSISVHSGGLEFNCYDNDHIHIQNLQEKTREYLLAVWEHLYGND